MTEISDFQLTAHSKLIKMVGNPTLNIKIMIKKMKIKKTPSNCQLLSPIDKVPDLFPAF